MKTTKNHVRACVFCVKGHFGFRMDIIWVARWSGLQILIPKQMWKVKTWFLEQKLDTNRKITFFQRHPVGRVVVQAQHSTSRNQLPPPLFVYHSWHWCVTWKGRLSDPRRAKVSGSCNVKLTHRQWHNMSRFTKAPCILGYLSSSNDSDIVTLLVSLRF